MLCADQKCLCHPRPKKPFQKLKLTIHGSKPGEFCRLDQHGAQLDVVFDLIGNAMSLQETTGDVSAPNTRYSICFLLDSKMWRFDNLKGLADNSLLLSFSMRSSFCAATGKNKMTYKERQHGFAPNRLESKLYSHFYRCSWAEQHLELLMPAERIKGWRTVALILKTFKCISAENWCHMIKLKNKPGVAGLDWKAIEKEVMPENKKEESVPVLFSEEDRKLHYIFEKKKAAAKRAFHKPALLVHH